MSVSHLLNFRFLLVSLLFPLMAILVYFSQVNIEKHKIVDQRIESFMHLPDGGYLKPMVIGYEQLVADFIWLNVIQVIGDKTIPSDAYEWIYQALDVVTTLDPKFAYAYQLGGITLAALGNRPDLSNTLLEKGVKENPDIWQIPFYLGFNNFFYFNNYESAAIHMDRASRLPGHPAYLPKLAARLYVKSGNPSVALDFLDKMYEHTDDEKIKIALELRKKEVIIERDALFLENAVKSYEEKFGAYPANLTVLVQEKIIDYIPAEPHGGFYYLDEDDKKVYSSEIEGRMKIYGKE